MYKYKFVIFCVNNKMKFMNILVIVLILTCLFEKINSRKKIKTFDTAPGPVIGILASPNPSNPVAGSSDEKTGTESIAQIDLNYVNWLQNAGARVVSILPWSTPQELDKILNVINGVVIMGGSMKYDAKKDYIKSALYILDFAQKTKSFVVWGTCNGFQLINHWAFDRTGVKNANYPNTPSMDTALLLPLQVNTLYKSKILETLSTTDLANIVNNPTTGHHHSFSVNKSIMKNANYNTLLNVAAFATNPNSKTDQFVNIVEGTTAKIFGSQFHPEKMLNSFFKKTPTNPNGEFDDKNGGKFFDQGTSISNALAKFIVSQAQAKVYATDASLTSFNPFPAIQTVYNAQIAIMQNNGKKIQVNQNGMAILSCSTFLYSWYSKTQPDPTKFKFTCVANAGAA